MELDTAPIICHRRLAPRGHDKWLLISSAVGTSNALQNNYIRSRLNAQTTRIHPSGREPGLLGANWAPRTKNADGERAPDWLASLRVGHASLYSSWERCSRFCQEEDLAAHVSMCHAAREALRSHSLVKPKLEGFWKAIENDLPDTAPGKSAACRFEHYAAVQIRINKALIPRGPKTARMLSQI